MLLTLVAVSLIAAFFIWDYKQGKKVMFPKGSWFQYKGTYNDERFMPPPYLKLISDYTNADASECINHVPYYAIYPKRILVEHIFFAPIHYELITDKKTIFKLELKLKQERDKENKRREALTAKVFKAALDN